MLCLEILDPAICVDFTLTCIAYINIVADQMHPLMEPTSFNDSGCFQQDNMT